MDARGVMGKRVNMVSVRISAPAFQALCRLAEAAGSRHSRVASALVSDAIVAIETFPDRKRLDHVIESLRRLRNSELES